MSIFWNTILCVLLVLMIEFGQTMTGPQEYYACMDMYLAQGRDFFDCHWICKSHIIPSSIN